MADLITEFFERELTETEADSLGDLLRESPDETLRFEGLLEGHYLATGLPSPQLPASLLKLPPSPGGWGGAGGLKLLFLLGAAGLGLLAWKFRPITSFFQPAAIPASATLSQSPVFSTAPKPVNTLPQPANAAKSEPVQPQEAGPVAEGEELSVEVGTQEKTLITVRVLNHEGKEICDIYTGFVQPGQWSFRWNGNLADGMPAPAGAYQIDVQAGALHQSKDIQIKPN